MPTDLSEFGAEPTQKKKTDLSEFGAEDVESTGSMGEIAATEATTKPTNSSPIGATGAIAAQPSKVNSDSGFDQAIKDYKMAGPKELGLATVEGVTSGTAPAIMAAGKQIGRMFSGDQNAADPRNFKQDVQEAREPFDEARREYPISYGGAQLATGLATQMGPRGIGSLGTKAASMAPRGLKTAAEVATEAGIGYAQDIAAGGDGGTGALIGAALPGVTRTVQGLAEGAGTLIGKGAKAFSPERSKNAVNTFIDNPELHREAQRTSQRIPQLEEQLTKQAKSAEDRLQGTLVGEKARTDNLYETMRQHANGTPDLHPDPLNSTSEHIRQQLKGHLNDPALAPVKGDLEDIINQVQVDPSLGREVYVDTTQEIPEALTRITTGDNLNMSVEMRKRVSNLINNYESSPDPAQRALANKLTQIRQIIDKQVKNADDFDPQAKKLLGIADAEYAKTAPAKKIIKSNLGTSSIEGARGKKDVIMNAPKIQEASADASPLEATRTNQALQDLGQSDALDPLRQTRQDLARQQELKNMQGQLYNPQKPGFLPSMNTVVSTANMLPRAGKVVAENPVTRHMQNIVRAQQSTTLPQMVDSGRTNEQINQEYKDNPSMANWLKIVNKSGRAELPESALESAASQYKVDKERLRQSLINLGKTITP